MRPLLCFILLVWSCSFYGQDHIHFKNYTINDGLSQSYVSCVVQDELGTLWLGTQDGINRFNGKNFEVFTADKGYDIASEYITTTITDNAGNIWFGTHDGLVQYHLKSEQFHSYNVDQQLEIRSLGLDKNGNVWIGTALGDVYKFLVKKKKIVPVKQKAVRSAVVDLLLQDDYIIVASEYNGVFRFSYDLNKKEKYFFLPRETNKKIVTNALIKHPSSGFLVATKEGIYQNTKGTQLEPFIDKKHSILQDQKVVDVLFLSENRFFIATESEGLFQVEVLKDSLTYIAYKADFFQKNTMLSDKLNKLFRDNNGTIWVASQRGLSSFDPLYSGFKGVGFSANLNLGLPSQNVWGFHEDSLASFLFIAGDHGVTRYDKRKHLYEHFYRSDFEREDHTTLAVHALSKNKVLVGAVDGIYLLKIDKENSKKYSFERLDKKTRHQQGFEKIYTFLPFEKKKGNIFLVGTKGGLSILDLDNKSLEHFYHQPDEENTISPGPVRLVFKTLDYKYYFSPSSGGVYEVFLDNNAFKVKKENHFDKLFENIKDYLTSFVQTSENDYWFGTLGDGLISFNKSNQKIKQYKKSEGLPNNVIYGVEKSKFGKNLWMSTNRGIVRLDLKNKNFTSFTEADGLMSDELNLGASFTSNTGEIYFGGIYGYNYFDPEQTSVTSRDISVRLHRVEIENEKITPEEGGIIEKSISYTKNIRLPYDKRSINLSFFANDLGNPSLIEYKYKLSGDDNVEEVLGATNQLRFTSLSPGEYKLEVFARTINTEWGQPTTLLISVDKPFWLTWWFYLIVAVLLAILVIQRVRRSIDKERRQQVRLELKIAERTKEIREKSEKIELQKKRLEEQKQELEQEKEKSERLLSNLLPKETASQLKKDGRSAARDFNLVSVMFTDFVGFTSIAENMIAKDLVGILDKFFRKFDEIIEEHDLEKIKTIGDAYMCAGGVPIRNKTNPINTVLAALQIKDYMVNYKEQAIKTGAHPWRLRIGINTGPVSAGVIGSKKYAYDVWGKTVNRAQRMEQLCEPERIAVTQDTFDHIEPYFECIPKGKVRTKGGLEIMMYEVDSIKPELSKDGLGIEPNDAFHKLVNLHFFSKINYYKAERFILARLKKELSPKLHYHSYDHSKDVTRQAERIAIGEGITDEDLFLLKTAATYHDAGFVKQYDKNEPIGAEMAQEILPNFGYTQVHIDRIKELIYVTQIPHEPKNKLEEIICDADLDYLGRDDFHEIADKLRKELREYGKIDSDRKWDEIQVGFLTQHRYFTKTAIETRRAKKMKNLQEIKDRLEKDEYKD